VNEANSSWFNDAAGGNTSTRCVLLFWTSNRIEAGRDTGFLNTREWVHGWPNCIVPKSIDLVEISSFTALGSSSSLFNKKTWQYAENDWCQGGFLTFCVVLWRHLRYTIQYPFDKVLNSSFDGCKGRDFSKNKNNIKKTVFDHSTNHLTATITINSTMTATETHQLIKANNV